jgi:hypothetical protein
MLSWSQPSLGASITFGKTQQHNFRLTDEIPFIYIHSDRIVGQQAGHIYARYRSQTKPCQYLEAEGAEDKRHAQSGNA